MPNAIFINTRPTHRAAALSTLGDGIKVLNLPLLEIQDIKPSIACQTKMSDYLHGRYDVVVATSVESAKRALAYLSTLSTPLPDTPIIAVGQATADVLTQAGLSVHLPTTANNEGMLQMSQISSLNAGSKVLIWRGVGGRRLLHDSLVARGVQVDAIAWYERVMPDDLPTNYHAIAPTLHHAHAIGMPIWVLVSSQMAFEHWCRVSGDVAHQVRYVALGERLAKIVQSYCGSVVVGVDGLDVACVLGVVVD